MTKGIPDLEKKIDVQFKDENLLKEAITHRSYLNENPKWSERHNERLEFLGDAVLELIVTEALFEKFPNDQEGALTNIRSALVNHIMLSKIGREISLQTFVKLSRGESKDTGKARDVIIANAMEAVIGAIYLDQGYSTAKKFIHAFVLTHLDEVFSEELHRDPKSHLQEIIQEKMKITPNYRVLMEQGPDHQKKFLVGVFFNGNQIAEGAGTSKQEAEREAAISALAKLGKNPE